MKLNSIKNIKNFKGKRVLLRLDLNVPLDKTGKVSKNGTWRLRRVVPTIKYLTKKGARVVIVAHLGRPKGKVAPELTLLPVAESLQKILGKLFFLTFSLYEVYATIIRIITTSKNKNI